MSWTVHRSNCGCLTSAPEPFLEDFQWVTSTDPGKENYQDAHRKWKQAWEAELREHKEETGHNCIG